MAEANGLPIEDFTEDLYADSMREGSALAKIKTYYESMWLDRGLSIKYIRFRLPHEGSLAEPDVEIPIDEYRSYNHEVKTTVKTRK